MYLGVRVSTNSNLTAATESWGKAKIEGAVVEDDGTVTLMVSATADHGFMIFRSKDATKEGE